MFIKEGFVVWARKTIESEIFQNKPAIWFKIFFYLVTRANHKSNKFFRRGSNWVSYELISEKTGATKGQIDHCFRWLRKKGMVTTKRSTRGLKFTIIKYDLYQVATNYGRDIGATRARQGSDTINKNEKNDKNDNLGGSFNKKSNLLGYYENNPVFDIQGKPRIKCSDSEWRDYAGRIADLTLNKQ